MRTDSNNDRWRTSPGSGLHAMIVNELGSEITQGVLVAGETLNPVDLGERFGVSRSVVREALRALESLGLVHARPQVGTRVTPLENWDLLNPRIVLWRGSGDGYRTQMTELLEIRRGVDGTAARLAAQRMTDQERSDLREVTAELARAGREADGRAFVEADVAFHRLLLEGSHNAIIAQFADTVTAVLYTRQNTDRRTITALTPESVRLHTAAAEAIVAALPDDAERCAAAVVDATIAEFEKLSE